MENYERWMEQLYEIFTIPEIEEIFHNSETNNILSEYKSIFRKRKINAHTIEEHKQLFKDFYKIFKSGRSSKRDDINQIIGTYGEILFYKQLLEEYDEDEIVWVSRKHSDIFGYDFLTYSSRTDEYTIYEVKSTISHKNFTTENFQITENEYKKFQKMQNVLGKNINFSCKIVNLLIDDKGIIEKRIYRWNDDSTDIIENGYTLLIEEKDKTRKATEQTLLEKVKKKTT